MSEQLSLFGDRGRPWVERFWARVEKSLGCWTWTGALGVAGYGCLGIGGRNLYAHRLAWELEHGPIPEGLTVDHVCHNADLSCPGGPSCPHRRCVNPAHMELVTAVENVRRGRGGPREVCKRGLHALEGDNVIWQGEGRRLCRKCRRAYEARKLAAKLAAAPTILCACGCGRTRPAITAEGKPARFIHGHNARERAS